MPKYQIILSSDEQIPNDEFEELCKRRLEVCMPEFNYYYAQNLEGVKKELWEKQEELKENTTIYEDKNKEIESTFKSIQDLFNIE